MAHCCCIILVWGDLHVYLYEGQMIYASPNTQDMLSKFFRDEPLPVVCSNDTFIKDPMEAYAFNYFTTLNQTASFMEKIRDRITLGIKSKHLDVGAILEDMEAWEATLKIMNDSYRADMKQLDFIAVYEE